VLDRPDRRTQQRWERRHANGWRAAHNRTLVQGVFMKRFVLSSLALLALGVALGVAAHTVVEKTHPATDAPLASSPPKIEIQFKHAMQMTSVVVVGGGAQEARKLKFMPATSAALITINDPALQAGRNEIRWKGLSKDGHVISGTLVYEVKLPSAIQ
jgi:copper resistance protein C